jgi:pimeloyl-ACP methyl ester carboxylesterase
LRPEVVSLPPELIGYQELVEHLAPRLPLGSDTVLLAESFSGPLAIMLAARHSVAAVILCNSFVRSPRPTILGQLAVPFLFRHTPPAFLLRHFLLGSTASPELLRRVQRVLATVPRRTLSGRLAAVLGVDVSTELSRCRAPLLYLRGLGDRLVPEASVAAMSVAAPTPIEVVRLAGPHLLLQVAPDRAWEALRPFLATLAAT